MSWGQTVSTAHIPGTLLSFCSREIINMSEYVCPLLWWYRRLPLITKQKRRDKPTLNSSVCVESGDQTGNTGIKDRKDSHCKLSKHLLCLKYA